MSRSTMIFKQKATLGRKGLTLIELLVVIAIFGLLAGIVFVSLGTGARTQARDIERIVALKSFRDALEIYYATYGKYPNNATGSGLWGFSYRTRQPDGSCSGSITLRFDNSTSTGFLKVLYDEGFLTEGEWNDPLNPSLGSIYNCRYIILKSERDADNVQHYLLHCNLESKLELESQDNGTNDTLYEIIKGDPWICVIGTYN